MIEAAPSTFFGKANNIALNYNWMGVLEFLQSEYHKTNDRENTWLLEKKNLQSRINELEGELKAADLIAKDLMKRNKMLEFSLRQERIKAQQGSAGKLEFQDINPELQSIPKRKPKSNKATLSKILTSLGIRDIFEEIEQEINATAPDKSVPKQLNFEKEIKMMSNEPRKPIESSVLYKNSATLTGHNDGVRDVFFHPTKPILTSVSEDGLVKVWDVSKPSNPPTSSYLTIRQHPGPIFSITGSDDYTFTGGMEGTIRCWSLPTKEEAEAMPSASFVRGVWDNSEDEKQEPVWQLLYSKDERSLFSTSSDSTIRMWSVFEKGEGARTQVSAKLKQIYSYRYETAQKFMEEDIPTTICFVDGNPKVIVAGFFNTHGLVIFDKETAAVSTVLKYNATGQVSTNKIISYPHFFVSAHEDKMIRVFDNNRMTHSFAAHDDSVMGLAMLANRNEFFSCSHDATVKLWDIRKFECLQTFKVHSKKYDQAIHCIVNHPQLNIAASGGSDATIKLYVPQ